MHTVVMLLNLYLKIRYNISWCFTILQFCHKIVVSSLIGSIFYMIYRYNEKRRRRLQERGDFL